jgi:hypothetical protein
MIRRREMDRAVNYLAPLAPTLPSPASGGGLGRGRSEGEFLIRTGP